MIHDRFSPADKRKYSQKKIIDILFCEVYILLRTLAAIITVALIQGLDRICPTSHANIVEEFMAFEKAQLERIFNRTSGHCHICWGKLCHKNYGQFGKRGAWEVEHSIAKSNGGTDHCNNLFAAHITCNRQKGGLTTRTVRNRNGKTCAPMSTEQREKAQDENTFLGAVFGGFAGLLIAGHLGAAAGAVAGGKFGRSLNPDETG